MYSRVLQISESQETCEVRFQRVGLVEVLPVLLHVLLILLDGLLGVPASVYEELVGILYDVLEFAHGLVVEVGLNVKALYLMDYGIYKVS